MSTKKNYRFKRSNLFGDGGWRVVFYLVASDDTVSTLEHGGVCFGCPLVIRAAKQ